MSPVASAAFCTFSVEVVPPVAKPDKSITASLPVTTVLLPSVYVNLTFLSVPGVYVPGVICNSVSFNCFTLTASVSAVPGAKFTILLFVVPSPMDKLPPVICTAGVLVAPPGVLLSVMEDPPLEIELIFFNAFAKPTLITVSPLFWLILVLMLAVLYSSVNCLPVDTAPDPCTVTLEPSLLVFSLPSLASKRKPLSINASDVVLRSLTLTAAFGVLVAAVFKLLKKVSPVDVPFLSIAEPTLLTIEVACFVSPAASWKDIITSLAATSLPEEPSRLVVYVPSERLTTLVPSAFV